MAQALNTGSLVLPDQVSKEIWKKAQSGSILAKLSRRRAQKFGTVKEMVLTDTPRAQLVGEGDDKDPSSFGLGDITVVPRKLQVTVRVTNEVQWADQDYQLGVWDEIEDANAIALARALDLIGIHKINPLTGKPAASITKGICDTESLAYIGDSGKYDQAVEAAAGIVLANGYAPDGVAFDNMLAFRIAQMRDLNGRKIYPEMGFGQDVTGFEGLSAAVGTTVSGKPEIETPSGIMGIVGLFDAFRWGVQREIKAELIEYGDPDGLGDLKRKNQVAIRSEIVYGVGIADLDAFALIMDGTAPEEAEPPKEGDDDDDKSGGEGGQQGGE